MTRTLPALLAAVLLAGCGSNLPPLSARGLTHLREPYRVRLSGTAVVLPILDCNSDRPDVAINIRARQLASISVPGEIWKQLGLRGAPQDGRLPESPELCRELVQGPETRANIEMASPYMREQLRNYLNRHGDRHWMVVFARTLRLGDRIPGPGGGVGALAGKIQETGVLQMTTLVYAENGEVAFRGSLDCSAGTPEELHDCGADFSKIGDRITEMLDGFPRSIVSEATLVAVPPPDDDPRGPRAAAAPAKRGGRK